MASAGAERTGLPASTFNAAGLNAKTVAHPVAADIQAVYVKGEPLRASQSIPYMPHSAATRTLPLEPSDYAEQQKVLNAARNGPLATGAALAKRAINLHSIDSVEDALAMKSVSTASALIINCCL